MRQGIAGPCLWSFLIFILLLITDWAESMPNLPNSYSTV